MKRISWTIVTALVATLFLPINAAHAAGTVWINPSTSLTTSFSSGSNDWRQADVLKSNSDGTRLVARSTSGQIVTSLDSGFSWQATGKFTSDSGMCLSSNGSTIFVNNGAISKLEKSTDFGLTWTSTTMARAALNMWCSADAQKIVMSFSFNDYQISTNSGSSWTTYNSSLGNISTLEASGFSGYQFQYSPDGNLLIANGATLIDGRPFHPLALSVSEDNGMTWRNTNINSPEIFAPFAPLRVVLAANGKIIVVAEKDDRSGLTTLSSTNKGQTWQTLTTPPGNPSVIKSSYDGGTLYTSYVETSSGANGTYKSTNFGQTWSLVSPGQGPYYAEVNSLSLTLSGDGKALSATNSDNKFYTYNTNSAFSVSSDASFTFKVNGQNVVDGATVNLPADTRTIEVTTITSQPTATVLYAEAYDEGNFNYEGPETCPTAGTCKRTMNTWRYVRNDSGVDTFKIEVTAPDQVTKVTKTLTVNQPFTKRIILKYVPNTVRYYPSNFFQEGLPGSGSGKPVLFPDDYEYGPYRTRFLTWSDGNTQNPRTDTFTKDVRVAGFWGLTPAPGKVSLDYFHDTRGTVTLVNSDGIDTFGDVGSPSFEQDGVSQQILRNTSGSSVRAVPNEGSRFLRWSDGSTANPRRDLNVASSFFVLAIFSAPAAAIAVGSAPNSQVATFSSNIKTAEIPATAALPAITLNFGGTAPTAVTVAPVASNPAAPASTPFKILGSTKIVDITPTGTFTGSATVCLDGGPTDSIFHFVGGKWEELPSRSYANGQVCGVTTSFSPFAAAEPAPANSAPDAPASVVATATGKRTATVSFAAPASNGGAVITSYTATSTPGSITKTLTQAGSGTFNIDGLQPGTSYTFAVTAKNANGTSTAGTSNSIKTSAADVASLTSIAFTDDGSGTAGKLTWVGSKIDSVLYTGPAGSYPGPFTFGAFSSSWNGSIRNLTPETSYTISIYAVSVDGVGESKSLTFKTGVKTDVVKNLAYWNTWLTANTYTNGEAARLFGLLTKFNSLETSPIRSFIKVPVSLASTVSATSLTPKSCSIVSTTAKVDAGMVKALTKDTCTISYTVSGPSKAPATMVKDFVFKKVG